MKPPEGAPGPPGQARRTPPGQAEAPAPSEAGLASGLMFAVLPQVSLYAQDAREYAMITALAATGSYVLVRALTTGGSRRGWLASYAFCLGVMGLLNVFSLLLIGAHAVTVAL